MSPYCQINMQHTIDKQIKRKEGGFRNSIGNNIKFFFLMCNNSVDVLDQKKLEFSWRVFSLTAETWNSYW